MGEKGTKRNGGRDGGRGVGVREGLKLLSVLDAVARTLTSTENVYWS